MAHQRANQWEDEEPRTPPKDWLDELALWFDNLDVPPLTKWQRVLVYSVLFIFVLVRPRSLRLREALSSCDARFVFWVIVGATSWHG